MAKSQSQSRRIRRSTIDVIPNNRKNTRARKTTYMLVNPDNKLLIARIGEPKRDRYGRAILNSDGVQKTEVNNRYMYIDNENNNIRHTLHLGYYRRIKKPVEVTLTARNQTSSYMVKVDTMEEFITTTPAGEIINKRKPMIIPIRRY